MINNIPDDKYRISVSMEEHERYLDQRDRRLYLTMPLENDEYGCGMSVATQLVDDILAFNREDKDIPVDERKPIRLYINSPGGDVGEGFAVVSAIKHSKLPFILSISGNGVRQPFLSALAVTNVFLCHMRHS